MAMQNLPSPDGRGWKMEGDNLVTALMIKEHAPKNIVELTACHGTKSACTRNCSCVSNLPCTDACLCMRHVFQAIQVIPKVNSEFKFFPVKTKEPL